MATVIFHEQENGDVSSTLLCRDRMKLQRAGMQLVKSHQRKMLVSGEKAARKALGNVNKQVITQKSVQPLKDHKEKAPAAKKVAEVCLKTDKRRYPEIEKLIPYNPADFETFDVPEEHKLSHLSLAGVGLMVNVTDARRFASLLSLELAPMEIPVVSWESGADSLLDFLTALKEITVKMPPVLQC